MLEDKHLGVAPAAPGSPLKPFGHAAIPNAHPAPAEGDENSVAMAWNTVRAEARKLAGRSGGGLALSDLLAAVDQFGDRRAAQASKAQPKGTLTDEQADAIADAHRWDGECNQCPAAALHAFKNFHRLLCERFGYVHDEKDWRRDQLSLIEFIAAKITSLSREAWEWSKALEAQIAAHAVGAGPLTDPEIERGREQWGGERFDFTAGVRFAERKHGIKEASNG